MTFVHDSSETLTADFDFTVTDGTTTTASQTFDFTITPVNDASVVTNNGATIDEGGSFTFAGSSGGVVTSLTVGGTPTDVYVDNVGTDSWILIGRGREGWEFDMNGQGNIADIYTGLATNAAFSPIAYDDIFVNNLMTSLGQDLTNTDVRIKRAADVTGTNYQEVTWTNANRSNWSWDLDGNPFIVDHLVASSVLGGAVTDIGSDTHDTSPQSGNNYERIWTFNWGGKAGVQGFNYGNSVGGVDGNDPNTFLWENTTENHATPYTEVYIKTSSLINSIQGLVGSDTDNTSSEIVYTVTSETTNGTVTRGGVALGLNDTFTQADLDNGLISYQHDGSETTSDSFDFTTTDGDAVIGNDTFNITITPVNDAPTAINLSEDVVSERETSGYTIGTLGAVDVDLPGDTMTYSITSDPDGKFALVGNELILNSTLSFATDEFHTVTIRTDDNNGGTFDQTFTINVERVDNFVAPPSNPNFGDVGRGELDKRDFGGDSRSPLIQSFVTGDGTNAFYGEGNLGQIIRQNTTLDIRSTLDRIEGNSANKNGLIGAVFGDNGEQAIQQSTDDNGRQSHYTRMVDFLKSTQEFLDELPTDNNRNSDNEESDEESILPIIDINQEFDNILTYQQDRIAHLMEALKDNS